MATTAGPVKRPQSAKFPGSRSHYFPLPATTTTEKKWSKITYHLQQELKLSLGSNLTMETEELSGENFNILTKDILKLNKWRHAMFMEVII